MIQKLENLLPKAFHHFSERCLTNKGEFSLFKTKIYRFFCRGCLTVTCCSYARTYRQKVKSIACLLWNGKRLPPHIWARQIRNKCSWVWKMCKLKASLSELFLHPWIWLMGGFPPDGIFRKNEIFRLVKNLNVFITFVVTLVSKTAKPVGNFAFSTCWTVNPLIYGGDSANQIALSDKKCDTNQNLTCHYRILPVALDTEADAGLSKIRLKLNEIFTEFGLVMICDQTLK